MQARRCSETARGGTAHHRPGGRGTRSQRRMDRLTRPFTSAVSGGGGGGNAILHCCQMVGDFDPAIAHVDQKAPPIWISCDFDFGRTLGGPVPCILRTHDTSQPVEKPPHPSKCIQRPKAVNRTFVLCTIKLTHYRPGGRKMFAQSPAYDRRRSAALNCLSPVRQNPKSE
jgi:hypothetical protein